MRTLRFHSADGGLRAAAAIVDTVQALGLTPLGIAAQIGALFCAPSSTAIAGALTASNGSMSADRKVGVARLG